MFQHVDAMVTPVSPFPAFVGEKLEDPMEMYLSDIYTITGDLAGIPCMSVLRDGADGYLAPRGGACGRNAAPRRKLEAAESRG